MKGSEFEEQNNSGRLSYITLWLWRTGRFPHCPAEPRSNGSGLLI